MRKSFICVVLLVVISMPSLLFAESSNAKFYIETYEDSYPNGLKPKPGFSENKEYIMIPTLAFEVMKSKFKTIQVMHNGVGSKNEANFRVVFVQGRVDSGFVEGLDYHHKNTHIDDLHKARLKHRKNAKSVYSFVSPWLRGDLYLEDKTIVGGFLLFSTSYHAILDELYNIAQGDWDKLTLAENIYRKEGTVFSMREWLKARKYYLSTLYRNLTHEELEKRFSHISKEALWVARQMNIAKIPSTYSPFAPFMMEDIRPSCPAPAEPFYKKLYVNVVNKAFAGAATVTDFDVVHNIAPSTQELKKMDGESGDYNCFITHQKGEAVPQ